jgi:hypothetical protein
MSDNCGQAWQPIYSKNTSGLKTVSTLFNTNHIPLVGGSEWRNEMVDLTPYLPVNEAKFRFAFTSGGGNNIFIDDINLVGYMVGQKPKRDLYSEIKIYPNPSFDVITLKYTTTEESNTVEISDLLGRRVYSEEILNNGLENAVLINTRDLSNGIYLIQIKQNNKTVYTAKFVKQSKE